MWFVESMQKLFYGRRESARIVRQTKSFAPPSQIAKFFFRSMLEPHRIQEEG